MEEEITIMAPYRQTTLDTAGREYDERRRIENGALPPSNPTMAEWLKVAIFTSAVIATIVVVKRGRNL